MEQPLASLYVEEAAPYRLGSTIALAVEHGAFGDDAHVRCDALIARELTLPDGALPAMVRTVPVRTTWFALAIVERGQGRLAIALPDEPPEPLGAPCEPVAFAFVVESDRGTARCRLPLGSSVFVVSSFDPAESAVIAGAPAG